MDGFTFITEIIKALAWPAFTIGLVFLLRKPIIELIPLMKKLKYKELEFEFSQEVSNLKAETSESYKFSQSDEPKAKDIHPVSTKALELVPLSTRAAIMEAWIDVETAAVEVASSFYSQPPNEAIKKFPILGEYLHQCKVIDDYQLSVFQRLRELRNKAAHVEELHLSENDAKSFVIIASNLAKHIRDA